MQVKDFLSPDSPIPSEVCKLAMDQAFNQIIITDIDGIIVYANKGLTRITGYTPKEVIGKTPKIWGSLMTKEFYSGMWKKIKEEKKPFFGEIKNKKKTGEEYWAILTVSPIIDYNGNLVGYIGTEEDATFYKLIKDQIQTEASISQLSHQ